MDSFERLAEKTKLAAQEILNLKRKNQQFVAELELLRRDLSRHNKIIRQNERYKKEREKIKNKLEKLSKKIEKLMGGETKNAEHN